MMSGCIVSKAVEFGIYLQLIKLEGGKHQTRSTGVCWGNKDGTISDFKHMFDPGNVFCKYCC